MALEDISDGGFYKVVNTGSQDITLTRFGRKLFDGKEREWIFSTTKRLKTDEQEELTINHPSPGTFGGTNFIELLHESLRVHNKHIYFVYVQDVRKKRRKFFPQGRIKGHIKRFWYWITQKKYPS